MSERVISKKSRAKRVQETNNNTDQATGSKVEIPLDVALSLLRPDDLVKLKRYVTSYLEEYKAV